MSDILNKLAATLEERKLASPKDSYVASLLHKGTDSILKKIGEEAAEVIMAAKDTDPDAVVREVADLWFHPLVLLASLEMGPDAVLKELASRQGISGHAEKAAREK